MNIYEKEEAKNVLELANQAFSDVNHTAAENKEKYGLLDRYAYDNSFGEVSHTSYSLDLLSAHLDDKKGLIWIKYTSETYNHDGSTARGSYDAYSLWKVEKNTNGQWEVVEIYDHP